MKVGSLPRKLDVKGPKFILGGAAPHARPPAEKFSCLKRVLGPNFNFLSLAVSGYTYKGQTVIFGPQGLRNDSTDGDKIRHN